MSRQFALQPPALPGAGPKNILEFIQRLGGGSEFRGLRQDDLQANIVASRDAPSVEDMDTKSDEGGGTSGSDEEDAAQKGPTFEIPQQELNDIRIELWYQADQAHREATLALDLLSLLLSKDSPVQAASTMSEWTRQTCSIGTLAATRIQRPTDHYHEKLETNKLVEAGQKLVDGSDCAKSMIEAASRLENEIRRENRYWNDVLGVSNKGWSVYRLAEEPQTLIVKFGFPNSGPEFKATGMAALSRDVDGAARLEAGATSSSPQQVRVTIYEASVPVGFSKWRRPLEQDAPLQDRVKEARDTVFDQELMHEIMREARTIRALGVRVIDSTTVRYQINGRKHFDIRLQDVNTEETVPEGSEDGMAEMALASLRIRLELAYREVDRKRFTVRSFKHLKGFQDSAPHALMRPIINYMRHEATLQRCVDCFTDLSSALQKAGLGTFFRLRESSLARMTKSAGVEAFTEAIFTPSSLRLDIAITPDARLRVWIRARPKDYEPILHIAFLPPLESRVRKQRAAALKQALETQPDAQYEVGPPVNPLINLFPIYGSPNSLNEAFNPGSAVGGPPRPLPNQIYGFEADEVLWYVRNAVPHALAARYLGVARYMRALGQIQPLQGEKELPVWIMHATGKAIRNEDTEKYGIRMFIVSGEDDPENEHPIITGGIGGGAFGLNQMPVRTSVGSDHAPKKGFELQVVADYVDEHGITVNKVWTYTKEGSAWGPLDGLVQYVFTHGRVA